MEALAWIGSIVEWFGQFFPRRRILDNTEGAVKYSGFVLPSLLRLHYYDCAFPDEWRVTVHKAGVHWYWPFTSTWVEYPIARQTDRLEVQTLESADGKTFLVSGTLTYEVTDLEKLVPTTHSPSTAIAEIAGTTLHDVLCKLSWAELQTMQQRGTLKTELKNKAQAELTDYGVKVIRFKLNTLARCRVFKVSQSTASEEN